MPFISSKKKAVEGDVVELREKIGEYATGTRGIVATEFKSPAEAYDLEMYDAKGRFAGFAYSVKPEQINNISCDAFVRGMEAIDKERSRIS